MLQQCFQRMLFEVNGLVASLQGHSNVKLQLAATFCISNLIWNEEDGKGLTLQRVGKYIQ